VARVDAGMDKEIWISDALSQILSLEIDGDGGGRFGGASRLEIPDTHDDGDAAR